MSRFLFIFIFCFLTSHLTADPTGPVHTPPPTQQVEPTVTPPEVKAPTEVKTPPVVVEQPKVPAVELNENDVYVLALSYFPEVPNNLPEGTKPSQYLKGLTLDKVHFVASNAENPTILSVDPKLKLSDKEAVDYFQPGQKFTLPFTVSFQDPTTKMSLSSEGALLMEVQSVYKNLTELKAAYKKPLQEDTIWIVKEDGTFMQPKGESSSELGWISGNIQDGWSDASKASSLKVTIWYYELMGCFIATAVYESWLAPELDTLRAFRDKVLKSTEAGNHLVDLYYEIGPYWAAEVKQSPFLKMALRPVMDTLTFVFSHVNLDEGYAKTALQWMVEGFDWLFGPALEGERDALHKEAPPLLMELPQ